MLNCTNRVCLLLTYAFIAVAMTLFGHFGANSTQRRRLPGDKNVDIYLAEFCKKCGKHCLESDTELLWRPTFKCSGVKKMCPSCKNTKGWQWKWMTNFNGDDPKKVEVYTQNEIYIPFDAAVSFNFVARVFHAIVGEDKIQANKYFIKIGRALLNPLELQIGYTGETLRYTENQLRNYTFYRDQRPVTIWERDPKDKFVTKVATTEEIDRMVDDGWNTKKLKTNGKLMLKFQV